MVDAIAKLHAVDDYDIEVISDVVKGTRDGVLTLDTARLCKDANAAFGKASTGDHVALVRIKRSKRNRAYHLKKRSSPSLSSRGESQNLSEAREREEKIVFDHDPTKNVSYNESNLPPLSADARALLDRIDRQAKERLISNPPQLSSGEITTKRRASLGFVSKLQKSVFSK
jgi:hypothetical protein